MITHCPSCKAPLTVSNQHNSNIINHYCNRRKTCAIALAISDFYWIANYKKYKWFKYQIQNNKIISVFHMIHIIDTYKYYSFETNLKSNITEIYSYKMDNPKGIQKLIYKDRYTEVPLDFLDFVEKELMKYDKLKAFFP